MKLLKVLKKSVDLNLEEEKTELLFRPLAGARLWAPFRALLDVVNAAICKREPGSIHDRELALLKHKPDFISLLKTPVSKNYYK